MNPLAQLVVRGFARCWRPRESVVTVLGYHRIAENAGGLGVARNTFEKQMRLLDGLRDELPPLSLDEALDSLADGSARSRSVVVTFDDAWRDTYEHALKVLLEHRIPATVYVPTGFVGRPNFVARTQLLEIAEAGIDIGAHTRTHPDLRGCTERELDDELAGSRADLEDLLGRSIDSFCYPFGLYDDRVVAGVARAGFRSAVTSRRSWLRAGSKPLRIPRSFVEDFPLETFAAGARGGMNVLAAPDALKAAVSRASGGPPARMPV
jgi:peptidoglycan/xylan/chitin deacetylase (PgdA/CDA1 family)